jgi:hypothetical protein
MIEQQVRLLNFVANQPEVLKQIAPGCKAVDLARYLDAPGTLLYGNEDGVLLFVRDIERRYEGHYMFTDTARRRDIVALCRRAITDVFTKHGASAIKGVTPRGNLGARAMNRALGLLPCGITTDTAGRDCIRYILERKSWQASLGRQSA